MQFSAEYLAKQPTAASDASATVASAAVASGVAQSVAGQRLSSVLRRQMVICDEVSPMEIAPGNQIIVSASTQTVRPPEG